MAFSLLPLDFQGRTVPPPLAGVRAHVLALSPVEGHQSLCFPDLCLYHFTHPTTFKKWSVPGVTLGAVLGGKKRIRLEGHELDVEPAQLVVLTRESEIEVAVTHAAPEDPYLGLHLCFGPDHVARALVALAEAGGTGPSESLPAFLLPPDARIAGALERLMVSLSDPLERQLLAPLVLDELLFLLLRSQAAAAIRAAVGRARDAEPILAAMQFMRKNHAEKLNIERLAKQSAMSSSHFAHRFSAVARMSPMRYLREVRLERARHRLLEGARVSEVALEVGFESPAHFTREFKRRFGVSPSKTLTLLTTAGAAPPSVVGDRLQSSRGTG